MEKTLAGTDSWRGEDQQNILNTIILRCLLGHQVERLNRVRVEWNQGTGWSRDLHLGINNIQIKKAMRLDEITKGVTVDGEEKRSWNQQGLGHCNI